MAYTHLWVHKWAYTTQTYRPYKIHKKRSEFFTERLTLGVVSVNNAPGGWSSSSPREPNEGSLHAIAFQAKNDLVSCAYRRRRRYRHCGSGVARNASGAGDCCASPRQRGSEHFQAVLRHHDRAVHGQIGRASWRE